LKIEEAEKAKAMVAKKIVLSKRIEDYEEIHYKCYEISLWRINKITKAKHVI
jgi:hypothetical protein